MLKPGSLAGLRRLATRGLGLVALVAGGASGLAAIVSGNPAFAAGAGSTTVQVTSSAASANYGDLLSFTASVASTAPPTPGGTVTFSFTNPAKGNTVFNPVCTESSSSTVTLDGSGNAMCTPVAALPGGTDYVTASYGGDNSYAPNQSPALSQTVLARATQIGIASNGPTTTAYGEAASFIATVTVPSDSAAQASSVQPPTNSVGFFANGLAAANKLADCADVPVSTNGSVTSATATCTTNDLPVGNPDAVMAQYQRDGNYQESNTGGSSASQYVTRAATSTSVTPPTSFSTPGQQVTITATITPASLGLYGPTGTVSFAANGTNLPDCSGSNAPAVVPSPGANPTYRAICHTVDLAVSAGETVTATYAGDTNYLGSAASSTANGYEVCSACNPGYWMVASDGGLFSFGPGATFYGSMGATHLNAPIVGMARDPATGGYWMVASDGGVFAFNAPFYGSTGAIHLNKPVVGMAAAPDGRGYWLVASDGGIFTFGPGATFYGSTGAIHLNKPVVGMAAAPDGSGYWLVASDGGIFTFGPGATFYGSTGAIQLNKPVVGMATTPDAQGYRLVASDGGIFTFGADATFYGSMGGTRLNGPIVGMAPAG